MLTVVPGDGSGEEGGKDGSPSLIDEIVREGARRMLAQALQAEVDAYIARFAEERDENGRRLVVRNGSHQSREVLTSAGAIEVTAPRVNDKRTDPATGERQRFSSAILPPWARKTPKITEVLPLLYLHGLSSGDFVPALGQFLGSARPGTGRWASGMGCGRSSPRPERAAAGFTRPPMSWLRCRSPRTRGRRKPWPRSGAPKTRTTPSPR
jgi:hypothetical protein